MLAGDLKPAEAPAPAGPLVPEHARTMSEIFLRGRDHRIVSDMHRAKELFESLDYTVRFVPVLTGSGGGPHCLSNVCW